MSRLRVPALLALGVVLTVLAFPPPGMWPLALVMLAPLAAVVERSGPLRAFLATYAYSAAMAAVIVRWLLFALEVEYGVPAWAAWTFTLLLIAAYAVLPSTAVALHAAWRPRVPLALAPVSFAALYALSEWLRAEPLVLPWVMAGQPFAAAPLLLQTAEWGGLHAPGFVAALAGAGVGVAAVRRSAAPLALPALSLAAAALFGALRMQAGWDAGPALRVGVVQASVPQRERFQPGSAERNTLHHVELTRALTRRHDVDLVVWSETAVDTDLDATPGLATLLRRTAAEGDALLVTGAPRHQMGRRTNAVVLFDARGLAGSYDKQVLVPFSEYDPELVGFLAPLLVPVTEGPGYAAGTEAHVFRDAPVPFAAPICFEITYPDLARAFRARGARLLLNLSNDAWFGRSGYADMHFHHAVFRAIELRTWVVRGANTGVSAVVDPAGRVVRSLPVFEEGTLVADVRAAGAPTFYARHGSGPVVVLLAVLALSAPVSGAAWRRRKAVPDPAAPAGRGRR